jgi:hypothetical protein
MPKQKDTKKPLFERCDVVRVMGVPSPLMLVIDVSKDTDLNDEFAVGVIYFHEGAPPDAYGEAREFPEGILQLVTPAAQVREEAAAATRKARGIL